ncbi:MAG: hypothetical protein NZ530_05110 [Thermodesulfobacteriaceae bacterium]|nr:hypothetical protein [Thermodesulfobacteriaceae bacterium]
MDFFAFLYGFYPQNLLLGIPLVPPLLSFKDLSSGFFGLLEAIVES